MLRTGALLVKVDTMEKKGALFECGCRSFQAPREQQRRRKARGKAKGAAKARSRLLTASFHATDQGGRVGDLFMNIFNRGM